MKSSARTQVELIIRVAWKSALRRSRLTHVFSYLLLALAMIPVVFMAGNEALEAVAKPTSAALEQLFFFVFAAFLVLMGLLGGTVQLETHKLFLYPVAHRTILVATALGRMLSPATLIFVALMVGAILQTESLGHALAAIAATTVFACFVYSATLFVQMITANLLRSRLLRDLSTIFGSLAVVAMYLAVQVLVGAPLAEKFSSGLGILRKGLAFLPSTWAAEAAHPNTGWLRVLSLLAALAMTTVVLARVAERLQRMALFGEIVFRAPRSASRLGASWRWSWLASSPVGAMLVKEIHTVRRDPLVKEILIRQLGVVLIPVVAIYLSADAPSHPILLLSLVLYMMLLAEALLFFNLFGLDDRGVAALFATSAPRWKILAGKNAALLLLFAPLNVGVAGGVLLLLDAPDYLGFAAGLGSAGIACVLSVGNFASCYFPQRLLTRQRSTLSAQQPEQQGCLDWLPRVCLMGVAALLSAPVVLLMGLPFASSGPSSYLWTLPIALLYATLALSISIPAAARALESREEELLSTFAWRK
jgi:hypothetical protein